MDLKHTIIVMDEDFHQNENLKSEKYVDSRNYNVKTYKNNSNKIKCGLSELSNDKFYLETELPARKRFKLETELLNSTNHLNKICKSVKNDDKLINFVNKEKHSGGISNILYSDEQFENLPKTELLKCDSNEDINKPNKSSYESGSCKSVFQNNLSNQCILNLNEITKGNFEKQPYNDFELNLKSALDKNLDEDNISNENKSETEFDDEINKCCELLNLDVPKKAVVETTAIKNTVDNFGFKLIENIEFPKSEISNHYEKNQSLSTLNLQSDKLAASFNEDIQLRTISSHKKLKVQDQLFNKQEMSIEDKINFKYKDNLVSSTIGTSTSSLMSCSKNYNRNESFHNEISVPAKDKNSFEFKYSDTKNVTFEPNNISKRFNSNFYSNTPIMESNTNIYKIHGSENNIEHLNLTAEDTLKSDVLKYHKTCKGIDSQNYPKGEIFEVSSIVSESCDTFILCEEDDIDADETKEIHSCGSELPILKETSNDNAVDFSESLDGINNISSEIEKKDNFTLSEKTDQSDENCQLKNKKFESPDLHFISHNDHTNPKLDESFVSEYEISLLLDDTASILSEESLDSEYEVSLLEDDSNDQENQNESCDPKYEVSLLEDNINKEGDQNVIDENKSDFNFNLNRLSNVDEKITSSPQRETSGSKTDHEKDKITNADNANCCKKESDDVIEIIFVASDNDLDVKKDDQTANIDNVNLCEKEADEVIVEKIKKVDWDAKKKMQIISRAESQKNINDKTEHFMPINEKKKILKLEESTNLSPEENAIDDILIKKEPPEKGKSIQHPLKLEIKNEIQNLNKVKLNSIEKKSTEKKSITISTQKFAGSSCVDKAIVEKIRGTELGASKNVDKLQLSCKIITNKIEKFEEKALIVDKGKQHTEKTSTDKKAHSEKPVKMYLVITNKIEKFEEKASIVDKDKQCTEKASTDKKAPGEKPVKTDLVITNKIEKFEEKALIVDKGKQHTEKTSTDKKAHSEKPVKMDLVITNKIEKFEEKASIVDKDKQRTEKASTDKKAHCEKPVKTDLRITNKIEKFEEKALIVDKDKKRSENTSTTDKKAHGEKPVKTDLVATESNDSKRNAENVIPDYYEEEKEDLINPGWDKIKELSTDEERYRQVRDCWESKSIPNPFKNLTYYSYRKKIHFGENTRVTRQHKRHASNNLLDKNAKRTRTCTYIFDDRIKCIEKEKKMETQKIQNKMYDEVERLNKQCLQEEMRLQNYNGYNFNPRMQHFELGGLRREFQERISFVTAEYEQKVYNCRDQYTSELNSLKNNRNEVLQFYSFYKGLSINENKDPTILTNAQMQELEEIENIYKQMDHHYR